jgi:hypothetical protein
MSTQSDLQVVHEAGLISVEQHQKIIDFLKTREAGQAPSVLPKFNLTHLLWYAGALMIIGAMGVFTNEAFNRMGGWALTAAGAVYAIVLTAMGNYLWSDKNLRIPGGLLIAAAVSMVPMMIYGVQDAMDLWKYAAGRPGEYHDFYSYVHGSWLYMEIGTIIAALLAVRLYPFPFILMIAGIALWFMSMDIALWLTATPQSYDDFETRRMVSLMFGAAVILVSWLVDVMRRKGPDFAFWLHIFGAMTFWGGLTLYEGGTQLQSFFYCLINIGLVGLGVFLDRRIYVVLGTLGIASYLGYLAYDVFKDVMMFSFALSFIGLAVIGLGLALNRNYKAILAKLDAWLPESIQRLRPKHLSTD